MHAAINASDAITGVRLGERAAGQAHDQALALLKRAGPDGVEAAKHLARLLPLKTRAEYDPVDVPRSTAKNAVDRAERILVVARRVIASDD